jgi:telomere length regulation protein
MALSDLTDKPASRLNFDDASIRTSEAEWYMKLIHIHDSIGVYQDVELRSVPHKKTVVMKNLQKASTTPLTSKHLKSRNIVVPTSRKIISRIVEIEGSDDDEDQDDIVPYAKPDSDLEDEEDDPTLVERNKPKAPVYIRDLMIGLRESENYDRHRLALETASNLVRRKATFGKEVQDHAEELLAILLNLNDNFEMDDFLELRQEALISLLVAQPQIIAPAIAHSCLSGDFSLQQRAAMLTALALGARELSGHKDEDRPEAPKFPSKELPKHLQQVYGEGSPSKLEAASQQLEQSMVQPLALNAADQLSGPNVLKVQSFSSRMETQKKKTTRLSPSTLAKNVAEWFFLPLINGWWLQKQSL